MDLWISGWNTTDFQDDGIDEAMEWTCSFYFDSRLDVIEQEALDRHACEQVQRITAIAEIEHLDRAKDCHKQVRTSELLNLYHSTKKIVKRNHLCQCKEERRDSPFPRDCKPGSAMKDGGDEREGSGFQLDSSSITNTTLSSEEDSNQCGKSKHVAVKSSFILSLFNELMSISDQIVKQEEEPESRNENPNRARRKRELTNMKLTELRALAKELNVVKYHKQPKETLRQLIEQKIDSQ